MAHDDSYSRPAHLTGEDLLPFLLSNAYNPHASHPARAIRRARILREADQDKVEAALRQAQSLLAKIAGGDRNLLLLLVDWIASSLPWQVLTVENLDHGIAIRPSIESLLDRLKAGMDDSSREGLLRVSRAAKLRLTNPVNREPSPDYEDLDIEHRARLRAQNGRCSVCGYLFYSRTRGSVLVDSLGRQVQGFEIDEEQRVPEMDHGLPFSLFNGLHASWNHQVLCRSCNRAKMARTAILELPALYHPVAGNSWKMPIGASNLLFVCCQLSLLCATCGRGPGEVQLGLRLRDDKLLPLPFNLHITCCECSPALNGA